MVTALHANIRGQHVEQLEKKIIDAAQIRMEREQRQTDASLAEADDKVDAALTGWGVPVQVMDKYG